MLEIELCKLSRNSNGHNFSLGGPIQAHNISRRTKLNNISSQEIQMVITFHLDVRLSCKYIKKLEIEHESSRKIQTAITFDSGV